MHLVLSRFLTLYRELINLDEPVSKSSIDRQTHSASLRVRGRVVLRIPQGFPYIYIRYIIHLLFNRGSIGKKKHTCRFHVAFIRQRRFSLSFRESHEYIGIATVAWRRQEERKGGRERKRPSSRIYIRETARINPFRFPSFNLALLTFYGR